MSIRVNVDPTNPGQFFACCGLLELAHRLWSGSEGRFVNHAQEFLIETSGSLRQLLLAAKEVVFAGPELLTDENEQDDDDDDIFEPLLIEKPVELRLDWWSDKSLKTWAGSMNVRLISIAMSRAIDESNTDPFSQSQVVFDPPRSVAPGNRKSKHGSRKKREPFYFDAIRGPNAHAKDIGFSPNDLKLWTTASPVVEFLCLIGLQRCRPATTSMPRVFRYFAWSESLLPELAAVATCGIRLGNNRQGFQFENRFRGQKKLKCFCPAVPIGEFDG